MPDTEFAGLGLEALAGSAQEIRERLKGADDGQIVALRLDRGSSKRVAQAVAEAVRLITPMIMRNLVDRQSATLEKLVDTLVPSVPLPEHLLTEARMNAEARKAVLESTEWLSAAQLSGIAGCTGHNASAQPNKWKREGKIFALRRAGSDYYPAYALDPDTNYRPMKGLAPILAVFGTDMDEWDTAIWFASASGFLGGARPMDLLGSDPARVLAAAKDEMVGVAHG